MRKVRSVCDEGREHRENEGATDVGRECGPRSDAGVRDLAQARAHQRPHCTADDAAHYDCPPLSHAAEGTRA